MNNEPCPDNGQLAGDKARAIGAECSVRQWICANGRPLRRPLATHLWSLGRLIESKGFPFLRINCNCVCVRQLARGLHISADVAWRRRSPFSCDNDQTQTCSFQFLFKRPFVSQLKGIVFVSSLYYTLYSHLSNRFSPTMIIILLIVKLFFFQHLFRFFCLYLSLFLSPHLFAISFLSLPSIFFYWLSRFVPYFCCLLSPVSI